MAQENWCLSRAVPQQIQARVQSGASSQARARSKGCGLAKGPTVRAQFWASPSDEDEPLSSRSVTF